MNDESEPHHRQDQRCKGLLKVCEEDGDSVLTVPRMKLAMRTWAPTTRCVAPQEIDAKPLHDLRIPLGDAMPRWGLKTMAGKALWVTKDGITSESGLRFESLCAESSLAMEHTCFKHRYHLDITK